MSTDSFVQEPNAIEKTDQALQAIVARAQSLYSLPTVALEVVQLTSHPKVDAAVLKECIERDPALTVKLLRVVNSSLFGLSREVSDLNQALALLGTKPLKLLVLGFSLPEELFAKMAREQLTWYWKTSLVRAVAARDLSRRYWDDDGDEAFLGGLLQDIGVLVLLDQLREPYAQFLSRVVEDQTALGPREIHSLGFDHTTLTAALLRHWKLPETLVAGISAKRSVEALAGKHTEASKLARVLHLAGLLAELVGQNRLQALPELLAAGQAYCGLDKQQLYEILPPLQEKVQQLADVLSIELEQDLDYSQIVVQAHQEMSLICESVAEQLSRPQEEDSRRDYDQLLSETQALQDAVQRCVAAPIPSIEETANNKSGSVTEPVPAVSSEHVAQEEVAEEQDEFSKSLTLAVGACRKRRCPISVLLVSCTAAASDESIADRLADQLTTAACRQVFGKHVEVRALDEEKVFVLPGCDRESAVSYADEVIESIQQSMTVLRDSLGEIPCSVSIGVATVALPPKNFHPPDLIAAAQRCLAAAQSSDANIVKSIEIF